MNSEILFRGKRTDGKGWVIGYYVYRPDGKHLIYWKPFNEATQNTYHEVIPETVGQFTGRNDVNDIEVYDGSIITNEDSGELQEVFWNNEKSAWYCRYLDDNHIVSLSDSLGNLNFVTGNIHDND